MWHPAICTAHKISFFVQMKKVLLAAVICCIVSSCTQMGADGRRWLSLPLPPDPLREFVIDACKGKVKPPSLMVPVKTMNSNQLAPPPQGYMFSSRKVPTGYEVRGVTGKPEVLSRKDFAEFAEVALEKGWMIFEQP